MYRTHIHGFLLLMFVDCSTIGQTTMALPVGKISFEKQYFRELV